MDRNDPVEPIYSAPLKSHSARGAWIETHHTHKDKIPLWSHSARGAWIETVRIGRAAEKALVALREGCVDRNNYGFKNSRIKVGRTPQGVRGLNTIILTAVSLLIFCTS